MKYAWPLPGEGVTAEELAIAEIRAALAGVNTYSGQARRDAILAEIVAALFNGQGIAWPAFTGGAPLGVSRTLFVSGQVSTVSASDVSLASYVLPANTLSLNGHGLRITVQGHTVGANAAAINIKFGATAIDAWTAANNETFWSTIVLARSVNATTQTCWHWTTRLVNANFTAQTNPTETLTGAVTLDFRGSTTGGITLFYDAIQVELCAI